MPAAQLSILFASERLLPAAGGAERAALEWLGALAARHDVRACFIPGAAREPDMVCGPPAGVTLVRARARGEPGYWASRRVRREAVARALTTSLEESRADVVVTQLHASSAVVQAAHACGAPVVLSLPSYESFCKYAFDVGSRCRPASRCRSCASAGELDPGERAELIRARDANERALASVERLVAPSEALAQACVDWCGRLPDVIRPVAGVGPSQPARPTGHLALVASRWSDNKGLDLLLPLCRELRRRRIQVTERGLPQGVRSALEELPNVFVGPGARIEVLLANASVLLVPSQLPEAFGRVAFEGLAAGVPTLAAAVGGLTEFVPRAQLIEPPDSVDTWVAAVRRLERSSAWEQARQAGIAAARALVADSPVEQMETVLREAAAAGPRAL